ncbi:MAG: GNAT family N-acetyltransferase [Arthrobacter sp.]|uniref:GNAT family N-acetyltransferase n=1 Tax=Arthrobacter sp. AOP36-A1-22 TaxID=3457684 RepID=UPI00264D2BD3|nr:GNAT family N-acetyltransferase [Micrococcaceae bacterium]MDN5811644.1 GNAT family N-acetyltransferase [Micrococcaceae bacterium]MDN5823742.1 GNAT family N-acetyltransferase [Micrococcaceae bacterium]MDN5879580.1 GNAT family N-acetyltransferase [Micrococcaceae bacterium]MDN5886899.1 GNAT family N-acetyltransferase [Micrococcaceae bacterium]
MGFGTGSWPVVLESDDLLLRPLRYRDKAEWMALKRRNADWLQPWEATSPRPEGPLPSYRDMIASLNRQARAGLTLPWAIGLRTSDRREPTMVGQLTVSGILWGSALSASLGYWVDGRYAGRGITPHAVALATDYCFSTLGLHRMEINIRPENASSLRVVDKLGFRDEGVRERFLHIDGAWCDHRAFALTSEEVPEGLLQRWLGDAATR